MQRSKGSGLFTHTGSFALNAGIAGAKSVLGVDASELAVEQARENAALNGLSETVNFVCEDVFELLPRAGGRGGEVRCGDTGPAGVYQVSEFC